MHGPRWILPATLAALAVGVAVLAFFLTRQDGAAGVTEVTGTPAPLPSVERGATEDPAPRTELDAATQSEVDATTTIAFPLVVELDLERPALAVEAPGVPRLGASATARLIGSIKTVGNAGVRGELEFVAGPNAGRTLYCDRLGNLGANDLFPGRALYAVRGPGIVGAEREVLLRHERESHVNLFFGRMAQVWGEVIGEDEKPIAGARVRLDGQEATTDEEGVFLFHEVAGGTHVPIVIEKPGLVAVYQLVSVTAGAAIERGRLVFRMEPGARLEISVPDRINDDAQAAVYVLPEGPEAGERKFPWHRVNPVWVRPGGTATIEDLPATHVSLRLFHPGAVAKPRTRSLALQKGVLARAELRMEPAPVVVGVVRADGAPVYDAEVVLEVPDRMQAMLSALDSTNYLALEAEIFPDLPTAVQRVRTNAKGEFQLSANEHVSQVRYLVARSPDGRRSGALVLRGGETRVEVDLDRRTEGDAALVLQTPERWQPLPVEVRVGGAPRDPYLLPAGRDLRIDGLQEGLWILSARWDAEVLVERRTVDVRGETTLGLELPPGAIDGQDADTLRRRKP